MDEKTARLTALQMAFDMRQVHDSVADILARASQFETWLYSGGPHHAPPASVTVLTGNSAGHVAEYTT